MLCRINSRLQHILNDHVRTFTEMDMIFTGDLRQLPPVMQTPIYKRSKSNFCSEIVWQKLQYYPLVQVMRQANVAFSSVLTKIGDGERLTPDEISMIESRFVEREWVDQEFPDSIRQFFNTADVQKYNHETLNQLYLIN